MALSRKYQKIFGKNAQATDLSVVGSKAENDPQYSTDIETIQSLANWETGMRAIVTSSLAPYLQDHNSLFYVITTQLAYLFQAGIAEWNSQTEYFAGKSVVLKSNGSIYIAIADNTNIDPDSLGANTYWQNILDWGRFQGDIYKQYDLWNLLLKGIYFSSYTASLISGYPKNTRVLYTNNNEKKYYVESIINNNSTEPDETNIWQIKGLYKVEGFVNSLADLPAASSDNVGQVYLEKAIVTSTKPVAVNAWVCILNNGNYIWDIFAVKDMFEPSDTIYVKSLDAYYGFFNTTTLNQIGYDNLNTYKWINNNLYKTDLPTSKYTGLVLGASGTIYSAPEDGWINIVKTAGGAGLYLQIEVFSEKDTTYSSPIHIEEVNAYSSANLLTLLVPIKKGYQFIINYNATGNTGIFRFIYSEE